jgi:hypothetical protein
VAFIVILPEGTLFYDVSTTLEIGDGSPLLPFDDATGVSFGLIGVVETELTAFFGGTLCLGLNFFFFFAAAAAYSFLFFSAAASFALRNLRQYLKVW